MTELKTFVSQAVEEFSQLYAEELAHCLAEARRRDTLGIWRHIFSGISTMALVLIAVFGSVEENGKIPESFQPLILGGFAVIFLVQLIFWIFPFPKVQQTLCEKIARRLNLHYGGEEKPSLPESIQRAHKLQFISSLNIKEYFWGEMEGLVEDIFWVSWKTSDGKNTTYHDGCIFSCHLQTPVSGITILVTDSLAAKAKGVQKGLKRVKLEWLSFEERFDVFSTDEKETRVVLAPDVMEVIYHLYRAIDNRSLCFLFQGNEMSCFYEVDGMGVYNEESLRYLFTNLYLLRRMPALLKHKLVARAWQEEQHLQDRKENVRAIEQQRAEVNVPDSSGITPIMYSIMNGDRTAFKKCLEDDQLDMHQSYAANGNTLFHLAVANNRAEMLQQLLFLDASAVHTKNKAGQTPLDMARARRHMEIIDILEKYE